MKTDDYIAKPKPEGYRAIHMILAIPIKVDKDEATVHCEIQIRSRLQHTWAHLSREDLYASPARIALGVTAEMRKLAQLLAKAEDVAERIRTKIARPRKGTKPLP